MREQIAPGLFSSQKWPGLEAKGVRYAPRVLHFSAFNYYITANKQPSATGVYLRDMKVFSAHFFIGYIVERSL